MQRRFVSLCVDGEQFHDRRIVHVKVSLLGELLGADASARGLRESVCGRLVGRVEEGGATEIGEDVDHLR